MDNKTAALEEVCAARIAQRIERAFHTTVCYDAHDIIVQEIRAALLQPVPVDTIKREADFVAVICKAANKANFKATCETDYWRFAYKAIASLDAVLSEGE